MKNTITSILILLFVTANAQIGGGWDWAFNTGALNGAIIKHLKYTEDGSEILFGGDAAAAVYFGTTTLTAPQPLAGYPGQIKFIGKINSATGVPTIIRSFINLPISFDCVTTDDAGNFYFGGGISSTTSVDLGNGISVDGFRQVAIVKLDASGNTVWAKVVPFGASGNAQNSVSQLAAAPSGNIYFWGFSGNADANNKRNTPLYKLDSSGNTLWFKNALNGSSAVGNNNPNQFKDKFIDNNENVHLFVYATGGYTFDGVAYPHATGTYVSTLISLNASGTITKAQTFDGGVSNFQVNRTTGNLTFKWDQFNSNPAPFNNLPHPLASLIPSYANKFTGMVETTANFNFIKAKDFSTTLDNPFQLTYTDDLFLALPNGKLLIQTEFSKTVAYSTGVDYAYPADASKYAVALVETDANWSINKFISGGKTNFLTKNYIAAFNTTYCMVAGFSNYDTSNSSAPASLPTTSYGSVNLIGFNAAPDLTTAYGSFSSSASLRGDVAIVQTKSENFPTIASTTWLGNTTNWNDATNWTNGVPTTTMKALFDAPTSNYPLVSTSPTAASLQVNSGVNLPLPTTLVLNTGLKNDGTITINNAGFFQGFGTKEWKGSGTVNFSGTPVSYYYPNLFSNSLVLNTNLTTQYNLRIPTLTLNTAKVNLNNKTLSITNSSPTAITTTNLTSYVYGGILERSITTSGSYEFPMGDFNFKQSAIIDANNLIGTDKLSATFTTGAITGTAPSTSYSGVSITSALNGGWFSINPNQQPTSGSYNVTLKIQNSTNTSANVGEYIVIKRDNSTSPWAANGQYNLGSTLGGVVTVKNSNLTSFSDFAIGKGATDISLSNESFVKKSISLYPNPATNQINVTFDNTIDKSTIRIISLLGQVVYENDNFSGTALSVDVSTMNSGIYFLQVLEKDVLHTQKFIKL